MRRGTILRRLINLIFADWVPHDNLIIGDGFSLVARIEQKFALRVTRAYPFIVAVPLLIAPPPIPNGIDLLLSNSVQSSCPI